MKIWHILTVGLLFIVLAVIGACEQESPTQPAPMPPIDKPSLSPQDAIGIAQEHSVSSPVNFYEQQAGMLARFGGMEGWNAKYVGNGKWTVELRTRGQGGSIHVRQWSVFESDLSAVFIGVIVE